MTEENLELDALQHAQRIGQMANEIAAAGVFDDYRGRKAGNTLRRQDADLALFQQYLESKQIATGNLAGDAAAWKVVTWGLVEGFKRWMLNAGYATGSINVRLSTIKAYSKLALKAGVLTHEGYSTIRAVEGYKLSEGAHMDERRAEAGTGTRRGYKKAQAVSLSKGQRRALKEQPDTPQGRRDRLMLCLLLDHGLRCGEMALLDVSNFDLETGHVTFYRPKIAATGRAWQTHKLTQDALDATKAYFAFDALPTGKLLRSSLKSGVLTKAGMSERAITARVNRLGETLGITGLSAHDLRHSGATQAAQNKTDPFALQEWGGWNSLAMPRRYVEAARVANERVDLGED